MPYIFTVILIGKSQSGKSAFVRLLQNNYKCIVSLNKCSNVAEVGKRGIVSCTTEINEYHLEINGKHYRIIDTPGLDDSAGRDHIHAMNLITTLRKTSYGLDLVLLIATKKQDFSLSFQKILGIYKSLLGLGKEKNNIFAVCFTHYDIDGKFLKGVIRQQLEDDVPSIQDHYLKHHAKDLGARSQKLQEFLSVKPLFAQAISFQEFSQQEKQKVNWIEQLQQAMLAKIVNQMDDIASRTEIGKQCFYRMEICEMAAEKIEQYVISSTNAMVNEYDQYMEKQTERDVRWTMRQALIDTEKESFMIKRNFMVKIANLSVDSWQRDAISERNNIQRSYFNKLIQDLKSEQLIPAEVKTLDVTFEFPNSGISYRDGSIIASSSAPFWTYGSAKEELIQQYLVPEARKKFGIRKQEARQGFAKTIQRQIRDYILNL